MLHSSRRPTERDSWYTIRYMSQVVSLIGIALWSFRSYAVTAIEHFSARGSKVLAFFVLRFFARRAKIEAP